LGTYHAGAEDSDLYRIIANGAQGTEMPDFLARIGSQNVWRLVAYLRSIARRDTTAVNGNAEAGKELYWGKGNCAACHMVDGKGGRVGPDLSAVGRNRSAGYMRTSLLDPDDDLTPGYNTVVVVTKDGKTITGVQRGYSDFSVQFMDVSGAYYSFEKDELKSMDRRLKSLMPAYKNLSPRELDDLLSYLGGLGNAKTGAP
jgi:quinoprotein glucose dehydrogenase